MAGQIEEVRLNGMEILVFNVEFETGRPDKVGRATITFPLESVSLTQTESGNSRLSLTVQSIPQ